MFALQAPGIELGQQLAQERPRVGEDADIGRIVATKLGGIEIDVDQFGGWEVPGITRKPRRGRPVVEPRPEGKNEIGAAASLVRRIGTVAANKAERQRIVHIQAAHAVRR